jgi:hypothetical protein
MMIVIGSLDFFEGLIAVIRKTYYVATPNQIIVFDTTTWGWVTMLLGVLFVFVGLGLTSGSGVARWTAIVILVLNLLEQLAWLGNTVYPLWTLTIVALEVIVLFALTARWNDAVAEPL